MLTSSQSKFGHNLNLKNNRNNNVIYLIDLLSPLSASRLGHLQHGLDQKMLSDGERAHKDVFLLNVGRDTSHSPTKTVTITQDPTFNVEPLQIPVQ